MNEKFKKDYLLLTQRLRENNRLGGIMGILHWDQEVIMPTGAAEFRAQQLGALAGVLHEKTTHPEMGKLLDRFPKTDKNKTDIQNFRRMENLNMGNKKHGCFTRKCKKIYFCN